MPDYRENEIEEWYTQYHQTIFKFILLMVRDYQQAEDLTHETFLKAYKFHHLYKRDSTARTWLFSIAHNLTIDYLRKQKPLRFFKEVFQGKQKAEKTPENIVQIKETSHELYQALANLKESYRKVIILRKIKGFSTKETAEILHWSESKVKTTLFRALPALEKELKKEVILHEQSK
ncbi:RNA polymerase sigma factor [Bacillaceae bacterium Marseille-Q3522]|nr:RNA polymerase sigma factor [Bacillaceae bacterium Marseille-Q3522]